MASRKGTTLEIWVEGLNDGVVNIAGGSNGTAAGDWVAASPVCDATSRSLDDGDERHEIPRVEDGVGHDICTPTGDKIIAVAITPIIVALDPLAEGGKGIPILVFIDVPMGSVEQNGIFDAGATADMNGSIIEMRALPITDQKVGKDGMIDDTKNGLARFDKGDERAKEIAIGDKCLRAINGIQHPLVGCVGLMMAEFLAQDAVVGKGSHNGVTHHLFGLHVGNGDRR